MTPQEKAYEEIGRLLIRTADIAEEHGHTALLLATDGESFHGHANGDPERFAAVLYVAAQQSEDIQAGMRKAIQELDSEESS